jgi:hypothetical protein
LIWTTAQQVRTQTVMYFNLEWSLSELVSEEAVGWCCLERGEGASIHAIPVWRSFLSLSATKVKLQRRRG